jgi:UDP-N-acetylglucosamine--N-acetylmuramyl-(pentapeptide) pyrophosphoryl-undecaprenol N-acetylglucosamine transferase
MATIGIACGGTGGHLYPGLAVAEKLTAAGHQVRLYVSSKEIDRRVLQGYPQYASLALPTIGWPGLNLRVWRFGTAFYQAYRLCVQEIREQRLAAVIGMGGFTSAPLLICSSRRRIPTLLHESNAIPGKVTRLLAKRSDRVLLGFGECAEHLPSSDCRVTGTPVRSTLRRRSREEAAAHWGLRPDLLTVTVIGGSQGASGLNRVVIDALPELQGMRERFQVIHQTGAREVQLVEANYQRAGVQARVCAFCDEMEMMYSLSDIMIARSGAASLTEISHFGLPSLLIPYPHAAENHQVFNARIFEKAGAALIVQESERAGQELARYWREWVEQAGLRKDKGERAVLIGRRDAAEQVAREVQDVL